MDFSVMRLFSVHLNQVRVARIFNTFGRRMHPNDGRVLSTFITKVNTDSVFVV